MLVLAAAAPRSLVVCFYSVGVDTDKDIEYSALAISQHFTQYAATTNTHCHADAHLLLGAGGNFNSQF